MSRDSLQETMFKLRMQQWSTARFITYATSLTLSVISNVLLLGGTATMTILFLLGIVTIERALIFGISAWLAKLAFTKIAILCIVTDGRN